MQSETDGVSWSQLDELSAAFKPPDGVCLHICQYKLRRATISVKQQLFLCLKSNWTTGCCLFHDDKNKSNTQNWAKRKNLTYSSYHLDQHWPTSGPQLHQWAPAGRRPSPGQSCCRYRSAPEGHSCSAGPLPSDGGRASFGSSCGSCWKVKDLMVEGCW